MRALTAAFDGAAAEEEEAGIQAAVVVIGGRSLAFLTLAAFFARSAPANIPPSAFLLLTTLAHIIAPLMFVLLPSLLLLLGGLAVTAVSGPAPAALGNLFVPTACRLTESGRHLRPTGAGNFGHCCYCYCCYWY